MFLYILQGDSALTNAPVAAEYKVAAALAIVFMILCLHFLRRDSGNDAPFTLDKRK